MKKLSKKIQLILMSLLCLFSLYSFSLKAEEKITHNKNSLDSHLTAKVSTMGFGLEYNHPVNSKLSIGIGLNKFTKRFSYNWNDSNTNLNAQSDAKIDFQSLSIIANYHPFDNGFRLRGGAYINDNTFKFKAVGGVDLDGTIYDDATVNGKVDFDTFSPYIGIGYGSEPRGDNRLSLDFDIGVMKTSPKATLDVSCATCGASPTFQDDFQRELDSLNKDMDSYNFYPVISFGLSYRF